MLCDREQNLPPLPAWPAEVMEHEPAHGLFRRIALANSQISTRTLAAHMGLNGRNVNPEEMLEFCRRFPMRDIEHLDAATPRFEGTRVTVCGQVFRRTDWSIAEPRVCAGCLAESRYHRTWFDLTLLRRCPIHGEPLIDAVAGVKLTSWFPAIGVAPTGEVARPLGVSRPGPGDRSVERYILGRMGVVQGFDIPWLPPCEVFELVEAADLLGAVLSAGLGPRVRQDGRTPEVRTEHVAMGFAVMAAGLHAIEREVSRALGPDDQEVGREMRWWLKYRLARLSNAELASRLRDVVRKVSDQQGRLPRRQIVRNPAIDVVPLAVAARELGISVSSTERLARHLGVIQRSPKRGLAYAITPKGLANMRQTLSQLVSRKRGAELAGVSLQRFSELCRQERVKPVVRLFGSSEPYDHFRKDDITPVLFAATEARSPTRYDRRTRQSSNRDGVGLTDTAAILGMPTTSVAALIASGNLIAHENGARPSRMRVTCESVDSFAQKYAPSTIYASVLRCAPGDVPARLRRFGLTKLVVPGLHKPHLFVRAEVRAALGLTSDPDQQPANPCDSYWRALKAKLIATRSKNRLVTVKPSGATILSGDRKTSVVLALRPEVPEVVLTLECDRARSARRFRVVEPMAGQLRAAWQGCEVEGSPREGRIKFAERLPLARVDDTRAVQETFDWLEKRMAMLRLTFVQRDRAQPPARPT